MLRDKQHLTAVLLSEKEYCFAECTSVFMTQGKNELGKNESEKGGGGLLKVLTGNLEIKLFDLGIWPSEPLSFGAMYEPD